MILERVARVDNEFGAIDDGRVVDAAMIGNHHYAVGYGGHRDGILRREFVIVERQRGNEWIAISDPRSAALQQQNNIERGRFTHIVDVALISGSQDMDVRTA